MLDRRRRRFHRVGVGHRVRASSVTDILPLPAVGPGRDAEQLEHHPVAEEAASVGIQLAMYGRAAAAFGATAFTAAAAPVANAPEALSPRPAMSTCPSVTSSRPATR
jgi:hypothetical protein